jgi:hypothetical protein
VKLIKKVNDCLIGFEPKCSSDAGKPLDAEKTVVTRSGLVFAIVRELARTEFGRTLETEIRGVAASTAVLTKRAVTSPRSDKVNVTEAPIRAEGDRSETSSTLESSRAFVGRNTGVGSKATSGGGEVVASSDWEATGGLVGQVCSLAGGSPAHNPFEN